MSVLGKKFQVGICGNLERRHKQACFPKTYNKIDNVDGKCSHMTLSGRKNENFQSTENISVIAVFFRRPFYQF